MTALQIFSTILCYNKISLYKKLAWNSFHALKWSLYNRHMALWNSVEEAEIKELESLLEKIRIMEERAARLPVR